MKKEERQAFLKKLSEAVVIANQKAEEAFAQNSDDGGSCNFDSAYIRLQPRHGITDRMLEEIEGETGCGLYLQNHLGPCLFVSPAMNRGQANVRSRMAEAIRTSLRSQGFNASMYYQMD